MALQFSCPHCQKVLTARDDIAGKTVICKSCKGKLIVPKPVDRPRMTLPVPPALPRSQSPEDIVEYSDPNPFAFLEQSIPYGDPGAQSVASVGSSVQGLSQSFSVQASHVSSRKRNRIPSGAITIALLLIGVFLSLGTAASEMQLLDVTSRIRRIAQSGQEVGFNEGLGLQFSLMHAQQDLRTYGGLSVLCAIILAGALMLWMHRAHLALSTYGIEGLRYTPAAAVYWWLVPFANLIMPFLVMRELWLASNHNAAFVDPKGWQGKPTGLLPACWWAAWVGAAFVKTYSMLFALRLASTHARPGITDSARFKALGQVVVADIVGSVIYACAAILAIFVIRGIVERNETSLRSH